MKPIEKTKQENNEFFVKLQIDKRTVIVVKSKSSLKNWMEKYPNAVILK